MTNKRSNWTITLLLIFGALFIVFPMYLTIVTAFKTPEEMSGNLLALPQKWSFDNFAQAIEMTNFWNALKNSALITGASVLLSVFVHSLISYVIARNMHKKLYRFLYYYIVSAMFVPFTVIMLPIVKQA